MNGLLIVICLGLIFATSEACRLFQNGGPVDTILYKRSSTDVPICIVMNDRYLFATQVKFDVYTRIVLSGSFAAVTASGACDAQPIWFPPPLSCTWRDGTYGDGIGYGVPTNYYVSVQGVTSNYRKRYAYVTPTGRPTASPTTVSNVLGVFPITTLVISVKSGVVVEVFWDDNCYFNQNRKAGTSSGVESMDCEFNAYEIDNKYTNVKNGTFNALLNARSVSSTTGYDTYQTVASCLNNVWRDPTAVNPPPATNTPLPSGFCDLGIYVTWVGTSADGQQLGSASPRFKRFRDYAMDAQYPTGHSTTTATLPPA